MIPRVEDDEVCDTYWGSHACDRPAGHFPETDHLCQTGDVPCMTHDGTAGRYFEGTDHDGTDRWSDPYPSETFSLRGPAVTRGPWAPRTPQEHP